MLLQKNGAACALARLSAGGYAGPTCGSHPAHRPDGDNRTRETVPGSILPCYDDVAWAGKYSVYSVRRGHPSHKHSLTSDTASACSDPTSSRRVGGEAFLGHRSVGGPLPTPPDFPAALIHTVLMSSAPLIISTAPLLFLIRGAFMAALALSKHLVVHYGRYITYEICTLFPSNCFLIGFLRSSRDTPSP